MVIETSKTPGAEVPYNLDVNSGHTLGLSKSQPSLLPIFLADACPIGYLQSTVGSGERSSSATAYIDPILHRKNLHVLISHTATRLLPVKAPGDVPSLRKVEFAASPTGASLLLLT